MTYEQYWYGDPLMVRAYYKAEQIRQRRMNEEAWLNGAYISRAIDSTICNAFRKNGSEVDYPKEPVWNDKREESRIDREQREEQEAIYAKAYMMNMIAFGKNWGKHE